MQIEPAWIVAGCAIFGVIVTWTSSTAGAVIWISKRLETMKKEILEDFEAKHRENSRKVAALETLVIRHDTILDPEFNGSGKPRARS